MTQQHVTRCLLARDQDAERRIGEAFLHNADECNDVFGHQVKGEMAQKAEASYGWKGAQTRRRNQENQKRL